MAEPASGALGAAVTIARIFERRGVPYAIGGALAYGEYAIPRATHDVDINVFVEDSRLPEVVSGLAEAGISVDLGRAQKDSAEQGLIICHLDGMRIDVFTPSIEFSWEALKTRVKLSVRGEQFWFLSAEALSVFKLLFFRGKDLVDLERLIAVRGRKLDAAYVRGWLVKMMGEDDPRTKAWDHLVAEFMPA